MNGQGGGATGQSYCGVPSSHPGYDCLIYVDSNQNCKINFGEVRNALNNVGWFNSNMNNMLVKDMMEECAGNGIGVLETLEEYECIYDYCEFLSGESERRLMGGGSGGGECS